jgi:hypothetical protein
VTHEAPLSDSQLRSLEFMESRIPSLPALEAFVAEGSGPTAAVQAALDHTISSRWSSVEGGHRVLILYEGNWPFDRSQLVLRGGAWDHEHCTRCTRLIPSLTLCWVTSSGPFVLLCTGCHAAIFTATT